MSENVKLQVLLKAVDQATRPFKAVQTASKTLAGDIRGSQNELKELNAQARRIEGFRTVSGQLAVTGEALKKAKAEAEALGVQMRNSASPTAAQVKAFESAKRSAAGMQEKYNSLRQSVQRQRTELQQSGIDKLLVLKAGRGVTASGKAIPLVTISRSDGDRHQFSIADRGAYTGVTAKWLHTKDPKPQAQKVKLRRKEKEKKNGAVAHPKAKTPAKEPEAREGEYMAGEADNVFALTTIFASKAQAMRAAHAKWDKLQRGVAEFSISLAMGRADLYPETPVRVTGFKRVIDEQSWIITKVTHSLSNGGFTTSLELEVKLSDVEYDHDEN